jgi:flagellar biosynthesis GTPase FlhF
MRAAVLFQFSAVLVLQAVAQEDAMVMKAEHVAAEAIKEADAEKRRAGFPDGLRTNEMKQAAHATAQASDEMKRAEAEKKQAAEAAAKAHEEMKQAAAEQSAAEQLATKARHKIQEADAERIHAEQKARNAVKQAQAETSRAEQAVAQARDEVKTYTMFVLGAVVAVLVAGVFRWSIPVAKQCFAEPLLHETKAFEGSWRREDGSVVSIDGKKVVHDDGKAENIYEWGDQEIYTHRKTLKKSWFATQPTVTGCGGKVEDGRIQWDDGRVWVKATDDNISVMGA